MTKLTRLLGYIRYAIKLNSVNRTRRKLKKRKRKLSAIRVFRSDYKAVRRKIRFLKISVARGVLKIFKIFPIRKRQIIVSSFQYGRFACNSKYLVEGIKEKYGDDYKIVWAFWHPKKFAWLADWGYETVRVNSLRYFYLAMTSGIFIYNMRITAIVPFRKDQLVINTGHGGGAYKKLLLDNPTINITDAKEIFLADKNTDVYLSSCKAYSEAVIRGAFSSKKMIWETGMPRNDVLVNANKNPEKVHSIVSRIKKQYSIPEKNNIILYAPTYRKGERVARDFFINWDIVLDAIQEKFGGEWTIVYRIHYFINNKISTKKVLPYQIVDASNYYDMQELLLATDILITDYSSTVWDYAHLHRPGFLYTPDIDEYIDKQGFYTDIDLWPFDYCTNNNQLVETILSYDNNKANKKIDNHFKLLGSFEDGNSTEKVIEEIVNWLEK